MPVPGNQPGEAAGGVFGGAAQHVADGSPLPGARSRPRDEAMGDDKLKVIAHELLTSLKSSITVDWTHREAARARTRVLVKRILRKYGYPPDLEDAAVRVVLQQAEALSEKWAA